MGNLSGKVHGPVWDSNSGRSLCALLREGSQHSIGGYEARKCRGVSNLLHGLHASQLGCTVRQGSANRESGESGEASACGHRRKLTTGTRTAMAMRSGWRVPRSCSQDQLLAVVAKTDHDLIIAAACRIQGRLREACILDQDGVTNGLCCTSGRQARNHWVIRRLPMA